VKGVPDVNARNVEAHRYEFKKSMQRVDDQGFDAVFLISWDRCSKAAFTRPGVRVDSYFAPQPNPCSPELGARYLSREPTGNSFSE
jgi:hypothetical protein